MARPRSNNIFLQDLNNLSIQLESVTDIDLPSALKAMLTEPATENKEYILQKTNALIDSLDELLINEKWLT